MITWLLLGGVSFGLLSAALVLVARRLRSAQLVSPILLHEALDPDLWALCRRLRRAGWLTPDRRRALAAHLVAVAAHRLNGEASEADAQRLEAVRGALSRISPNAPPVPPAAA